MIPELLAAAAVVAASPPHPDPTRERAVSSTSYCLHGTMADGTGVRFGSAANNELALGTRIWIRPAFRGRHRFVVRDRIGWGTQLDLYTVRCADALAWGRRVVRMSVGWPRTRDTLREVQ